MSKIHKIEIHTSSRNQIIDITADVQKIVDESDIRDGVAHIFVPHTTAAVTINENYDPSVKHDILNYLERLIPRSADFRHSEGNSDAHIKSSLVGTHQIVFVEGSRLLCGTWQGICFCEFDGPRTRMVIVKLIQD